MSVMDHHPLAIVFRALAFSAEKHRHQRRKDRAASPYINHPIQVTELLVTAAGVTDTLTILAAILHDTLEDTRTHPDEIRSHFGADVLAVVEELSDDKSLSRAERKHLQIQHAPAASRQAKLVKIADKVCNVRDIIQSPPADWSADRQREYLEWTGRVVEGCRGVSPDLEAVYDRTAEECRRHLAGGTSQPGRR